MGGKRWIQPCERKLSSHQSGETDIFIRKNIIKIYFMDIRESVWLLQLLSSNSSIFSSPTSLSPSAAKRVMKHFCSWFARTYYGVWN